MNNTYCFIIEILGIPAVISTGIYFIFKSYIKNRFDKELKTFKSNLDKEIIEFEVKFKNVHLDRYNIIKEIYKNLLILESAIFDYLKTVRYEGETSDDEKFKKIYEVKVEYFNMFLLNEILFEQKTCEILTEINSIFTELIEIVNKKEFNRKHKVNDYGTVDIENQIEEFTKEIKEIKEKLEKKLPELKEVFKNEIREIFGVNNKS